VRNWIAFVAKEATLQLPDDFAIAEDPVCVSITHYFEAKAPDVNNIIKPILDGLKGVVYKDDALVIEVSSRKRPIAGSFRNEGATPELIDAVANGFDFVHVVVHEASETER